MHIAPDMDLTCYLNAHHGGHNHGLIPRQAAGEDSGICGFWNIKDGTGMAVFLKPAALDVGDAEMNRTRSRWLLF